MNRHQRRKLAKRKLKRAKISTNYTKGDEAKTFEMSVSRHDGTDRLVLVPGFHYRILGNGKVDLLTYGKEAVRRRTEYL